MCSFVPIHHLHIMKITDVTYTLVVDGEVKFTLDTKVFYLFGAWLQVRWVSTLLSVLFD